MQGQPPGVHGGVRHRHGGFDVRAQARFQGQGLPAAKTRAGMPARAPVQKRLQERQVPFGEGHEQPVVLLQGLGDDAAQDPVFPPALAGRGRVVQHVARAAVQQPVVAAGGAGQKLTFFEQRHPESTQGQVVGQGPPDPPADDHHVFHFASCRTLNGPAADQRAATVSAKALTAP